MKWHHGEAFTLLRLSVMDLVGARFSRQDLDETKCISGEAFSPHIATVETRTREVTWRLPSCWDGVYSQTALL
jgi:hypothetical protein